MVYRCIVCSNQSSTCSRNISFYKFPESKICRARWIKFCRLTKAEIFKSSRLCSSHFCDDDFIDNRVGGGRRVLKKGRIPSVFKVKKSGQKMILDSHQESLPEELKPSFEEVMLVQNEHNFCSFNETLNQIKTEEVDLMESPNISGNESSDEQIQIKTENELTHDDYSTIIVPKVEYDNDTIISENNVSPPSIVGNRIVEINYLLRETLSAQFNHTQACPSDGLLQVFAEEPTNSKWNSRIILKCNMCGFETSVLTISPGGG